MISPSSCREDASFERGVLLKRLQSSNKYMKQREEEAAAHREAARAEAQQVEKKMRHQEETISLLQQQLEAVQQQQHEMKMDLLNMSTDALIYNHQVKILEEENSWLREEIEELKKVNVEMEDLREENNELKQQLVAAETLAKELQDHLDQMDEHDKIQPLQPTQRLRLRRILTAFDEDLFFFMKNQMDLPVPVAGEEQKNKPNPITTIHLNRTDIELLYEMASPARKKEIQDVVFGVTSLRGRPSRDFLFAMRNKHILALRREYEAQQATGVFSEAVRDYMTTQDFAIVYGPLSTYQTIFDALVPLQKKAVSLILRDGWGVRNLTYHTRQAWNAIDESMREFVLNEADRLHAHETAQVYL